MNSILRSLFLVFSSVAIAFSQVANPTPAATTAPNEVTAATKATNHVAESAESDRAAAALTKLGVPLERDAGGRIRWIIAARGELSDEAMKYLPGLPMLEWLEIGGGNLSAAGMSSLGGCTSLRRLYI